MCNRSDLPFLFVDTSAERKNLFMLRTFLILFEMVGYFKVPWELQVKAQKQSIQTNREIAFGRTTFSSNAL